MTHNRTAEHLAFLSRQLSALSADQAMPDAIAELRKQLPEAYQADLGRLEDIVISTKNPERTPGESVLSAYPRLAAALPESARSGLFPRVSEFVDQQRSLFSTYWAGLVSQMWYLGWVLLVAVLVASIMSGIVIPSFEVMFSTYNARLPGLTRAVFQMEGLWFGALVLAGAVAAAVAIIGIATFSKRIASLAPAWHWHRYIPGFSPSVAAYNMSLFLNFTRILIESGLEEEHAVRISQELSSIDAAALLNEDTPAGDHEVLPNLVELRIARSLGLFRNELEAQCDFHPATLATALTKTRDSFSWAMRLILYLVVGILVVACYLPIFSLGTVI
ncbi:MAG: hypothetical protein AAFQ99_08410 [Pseudomonadota bacterium]